MKISILIDQERKTLILFETKTDMRCHITDTYLKGWMRAAEHTGTMTADEKAVARGSVGKPWERVWEEAKTALLENGIKVNDKTINHPKGTKVVVKL